jgi:shikimate dehydrogenase
MKYYGLIGHPLSHSFSKQYFTEKFERENVSDASYELYPLENIDDLPKLLSEKPGLCGINVTIPYKISVIKLLDWIEHDAKTAGAVNCIRITSQSPVEAAFLGEVGFDGHDFRLEGFNTDLYGFDQSLSPLLKKQHDNALVLGDGGAAKAVKCVLDNKGINYRCVTRKPHKDNLLFDQLKADDIKYNKLIINTTPLGMYPNVDDCPAIPYDAITDEHLLFDLIYNPEETLFLKKARERGAVTKNGYEMLILQAERSWEIWNSREKHP